MERYSSRAIDDSGKLALHGELRQRLGLETGDSISLTLVDTIVILQRADSNSDCDTHKLDDLGRVVLPAGLRQTLGWKEKDKVALFHTDNLIILKSA